MSYKLKGVNARVSVIWNFEAPAGAGDTHFASYRGTRARVEVRQGKAEQYRPEVYVVANRAADKATVLAAVKRKIAGLQGTYPGFGFMPHPLFAWCPALSMVEVFATKTPGGNVGFSLFGFVPDE